MSIRETRFGRLVGHFFTGFLENDLLMSADTGMQNALSQALGLIIAPGLFYCFASLFKFGSVPDRLRQMVAWEDRFFFVGIAMVMTGLLTVIEWDALFPDWRDYQILTPLPLTARMLFSAKLCSVLLLLAVFWAAGSAAPAILYSAVVLGTADPWFAFPRHIMAHLAATLAASAFVFLSCAGLQGLLMSLLPPKWFRRLSAYVQLALVVVLVLSLLLLLPLVANSIQLIRGNNPWLYFLPPFWFMGLYQELVGRGGAVFSPLAAMAVKALGVATAISALAWAASYKRHVKKSLETLEPRRSGPGWRASAWEALLHRFVLRHPIERACFHFVASTLVRSGLHRLLLAAYCGVGFALAACLAATLFTRSGSQPTPIQLSVQLVLPFFLLSGMRMAFALPAELRANWAFQAVEPRERIRCDAGVRKAMLLFGFCPVMALLPAHAFLWGWPLAAAHLLYGALLAALLVEALLLGFDKIPFTCTYLPGKANVKALWPVYLVAFWAYAFLTAKLESALLSKPASFAFFCAAALALTSGLRRYRNHRLGPGFRFQFEDLPEPAVRTLGIGYGSVRPGEETRAPAGKPVEFRPAPQTVWPDEAKVPRGPQWARISDELRGDMRHGFRTLMHNLGFTLTAVFILGLAIGANTMLFTYFSALVLKPLPLTDRQRNVELKGIEASLRPHDLWSYTDLTQMRSQNRALEEMYGWSEAELPVREPAPRTWKAVLVTGNFFRLFNARMVVGRAFGEREDEVPGRDPVLVISHRVWHGVFQEDPAIAGKLIRIRQTAFTILGVADPAFTGTDPLTVPDVWVPVAMRDQLVPQGGRLADPDNAFLKVAGLLKPGLSLPQARDRMFATIAGVNVQHPASMAIQRILLEPRPTYFTLRGPALVAVVGMFSLVGLLLLIACANLAGVLLARGLARQREIAIRASIGASRGRLIRQLLTESVLLAAIAAVPALLLTEAATDAFQRYLYTLLIRQGYTIQPVSPDWRVFLFTAALALAAGILLGLAPALEATRANLAGSMKEAGAGIGGRRAGRVRELLVVGQVAASLVLLVMAAVFVRSSQRIHRLDPGFDTDHTIDVRADGSKTRLAARLRADSRFEVVSEASRTPLSGWPQFLPGKVNGKIWMLGYNYVESGYFDAFGIPVRHGRKFTALEARAQSPFAIVSDVTARLLWPNEDPLGKLIEVSPPKGGERFAAGKYEVVGVVPNVINGVLYLGKDYTAIYLPAAPGDPRNRSLILRSRETSRATITDIKDLCANTEGVNGCEPITLREMVWQQRFPYMAASTVSTGLGILALLMTCIGLWGVVTSAVVQRTREIGIRMALGATPASVLRSILKQGVLRVMLGIVLGIPGSLVLSKVMTRVLVPGAVQVFDPRAYVTVTLSLAVVALTAAWIPARRATRIDPMAALRQD